MRKLVIGCGYLGSRVAERWLQAGHEVWALTRSAERAAEFQSRGMRPVIGDVTDAASLSALPTADTLLYAVGYDRKQAASLQQVYVDGLRNVLTALGGQTRQLIYISSTGVYGSSAGEWVNEQSPCEPEREGGQACLGSEQLLASSPFADRTIILRMAGLYGPGRIPRVADIVAGKPIAATPEAWLNLIHIEDAADIAVLAEEAPAPRTYVVSDGQPVQRQEYFAYLAELLGAPAPKFVQASPAELGRGASDKRIDSARLRADLRPRLRYPSYREGLAAVLRAEPRAAPAPKE